MHNTSHNYSLYVHQRDTRLLLQHHAAHPAVPNQWGKGKKESERVDDNRLFSPCSSMGMESFFFISSITDEHLACWWEGRWGDKG